MNFKEFLTEESKHRREIELDEAVRLLNTNCKDAVAHALRDGPMWRGDGSHKGDAYLMRGELGDRKSKGISNYYTILIDYFLSPNGYPKRSGSVICGNNDNHAYVKRFYGNTYALFPYDGVKIGVVPVGDIRKVEIYAADTFNKKITVWNDMYQEWGLSDKSYSDFMASARAKFDNPTPGKKKFPPMNDEKFGWKNVSGFEKWIKQKYGEDSLDMSIITSADLGEYVEGDREMWVGGKCISIREDLWNNVKKKLEHDAKL